MVVPALYLAQAALRREVTVSADGAERAFKAGGETVADLLQREGLALGPLDRVEPGPDAPARSAGVIRVVRVDRRRYVTAQPIPRRVVKRSSPHLHVGEVIDLVRGEDGYKAAVEEVVYTDGLESSRRSVRMRTVRPPQDAVVLAGTSTQRRPYMMGKRMTATKEMELEATAYYPGAESSAPYDDGYTALGWKAGYGVAAVDPRLIPLKTPLYVEGYGYAVAADRGGDIRRRRIDLCFNTLEEAKAFGRRKAKVYVLR
jgi:3D (Asp-Asp-Asp) domain-containing protein